MEQIHFHMQGSRSAKNEHRLSRSLQCVRDTVLAHFGSSIAYLLTEEPNQIENISFVGLSRSLSAIKLCSSLSSEEMIP
jgi:hypothetical protein